MRSFPKDITFSRSLGIWMEGRPGSRNKYMVLKSGQVNPLKRPHYIIFLMAHGKYSQDGPPD
jgi:hypothetical protein